MPAKNAVYVATPLRPSTAKKVKEIAAKSKRSVGRQVSWIVERFLAER